ncbi:MAG: RNA polymerase sigma factor [Ignavibacteriales bacterium]|nr:RNA polymerase sigma factor [Ignavibacteriales bacterium]
MTSIPLTVTEPVTSNPVGGLTETIILAQQGDKKAFEQLYHEHVGRVYAVCVRILAESRLAEELTQDVFVRAWQMLPSFRGEAAFSSWLHRLAVNVVLVYFRTERRRKARVTAVDDLTSVDRGDHGEPPGGRLDLDKAIAGLPPQARAIFVLHDIDGYKHEEIAEQLGLAVGTSKAQLHRARKLLMGVLNQ